MLVVGFSEVVKCSDGYYSLSYYIGNESDCIWPTLIALAFKGFLSIWGLLSSCVLEFGTDIRAFWCCSGFDA